MRSDNKESAQEETDDSFYCFEVRKILPGDILLTASPTGKNSRVIRKVTGSDFSHAAICTEPGIFVEAIGAGIRRINLEKRAARDIANIKLLRIKEEMPDRQQIAQMAANEAEACLTLDYWLKGAIKSIMNKKKPPHTTEFFCSHLVAHAYREAGLELVPNRIAENVYPGAILESESFEDIATDVVVKQRPVSWMYWSFLEDADKETPHSVEVTTMQRIHRRMSKVFKSHGLVLPADFYNAVLALARIGDEDLARELDREFSEALDQEGYMALIEEDRFPTIMKALTVDSEVDLVLTYNAVSDADIAGMLRIYISHRENMPEQVERRDQEFRMWRRVFSSTQFDTINKLVRVAETMSERQKRIAVAIDRAIAMLEARQSSAS